MTGDEAVAEGAAELAVGDAAVAGELVDAEVFVEVFEVVFLDPAAEHEPDDLCGGAAGIVRQDGELGDGAAGAEGLDDDPAELEVGGPFFFAP